eukprot:TRINITY_DN5914_c4_g1_i1.p1 TRINITY_DN5914_c4_g1~~TRINITY_DN5914_c4_g1_i1.p1  ORF type:complete len:158 (-),score=72.50 TRINITY_DN5914_c4_g1_i1:41-514(-)
MFKFFSSPQVEISADDPLAPLKMLNLRLEPQLEDLVVPNRKLIKEGEVVVFLQGTNRQIYQMLLFNDIILFAEKKEKENEKEKEKLGLKYHITLTSSVRLQDDNVGFILECPRKTFHISTNTEEEKQNWLKELSNQLKEPKLYSAILGESNNDGHGL